MSEIGYYRHATIHKDNIVFVCEDDLFCAPASGGIARRLTAGHGQISQPRLSRDGKQIAYVGREEGDSEVYVMPAEGGVARRLTYLCSEVCIVAGWSEAGDEIIFGTDGKSAFMRHSELFAVSAGGSVPRNLNYGHGVGIALAAEGTVVARNNLDPARWKRYRGGTAGELWIDENNQGKFRRLPKENLKGNEAAPMWIGGRVYFLSDHEGVGNIYSCTPDGSDLRRHTNESEYYVRFPSTDGQRIVYTRGGDIVILDPSTNKPQQVNITIPGAPRQTVRKFVKAADGVEHFGVHPKGSALTLICRGQPFTMPNWEEAALQHGIGSGARYRHADWLPDGKRFVVLSDEQQFERLEVHHADQLEAVETVTDEDLGRAVVLAVSPTENIVAIANHKHELLLINIAKKSVIVVDRSPADRIGGLAFSADGKWLAYSFAPHSNCSIIKVVEVASCKTYEITDTVRNDFAPCFDPEGNYLYFLSNREFNPVYDSQQFELSFPVSTKPYCVALTKDVPSPFLRKIQPPFDKSDPRHDLKPVEKGPLEKTLGLQFRPKPVEIDFDDIKGRILRFPVDAARYEQLVAIDNRILTIKFEVKGIERGGNWWDEEFETGDLLAYDFSEGRFVRMADSVTSMRLSSDARTLVYRSKKKLRVFDAQQTLPEDKPAPVDDKPGWKSGFVDLARVNVMIEPQKEWQQMYNECWRLQREHFWDESMSSVDWELVRHRYAKLLPRIRCRSELSDLLWEMQGELGTSHAYEFGGDYKRPPAYHRGYLGADLSFDKDKGGYRIDKIIRGSSWDQDADSALARPGCGIAEGDVITAVGGRKVSQQISVEELLLNTANQEVALTIVQTNGNVKQATVRPTREERYLRYRQWVENNRKIVHEMTEGRVGYLHIPDMGPWGFAEFHKGYLLELHRDGLVVDVRYNRGGHVSALLLEKLLRKRVGYDVSRWGMPQPYPTESVAGPMVALTNQFAGSDGDIFSHCFKMYKLGQLIGTRTWGGVIGIWPRHRLVDGTITTQPEFSFWFSDVGWKVENYGTDPDIEVDYCPHDYTAKHDPQLAKAIQVISDELARNPFKLPDFSSRPALPLPQVLAASTS